MSSRSDSQLSFGGSNFIFQFYRLTLNLFLRPLVTSIVPLSPPLFSSVIASGPRQGFPEGLYLELWPRQMSYSKTMPPTSPILHILLAEKFKTYHCLPAVYILTKESFQKFVHGMTFLCLGSQVENMILPWPVISMAKTQIHPWFITPTQFLPF